MTSLASPLPDVQSDNRHLLPVKLALTLGLAACADWLFWSQRIGLSFVLFAVALFASSWLGNFAGFERRRAAIAAVVLLAGLVPAVEELNTLSFFLAVAALVVSVAILTNPDFSRLADGLRAFLDLFLFGPFRLIGDVIRMTNVRAFTSGFALWFVPLLFSAIFVALFASANPLIERWIPELNPKDATSQINLARTLFWAFVLSTVWPFIHVRWRRRKERITAAPLPVVDDRRGTIGLLQPLWRGDDPALADPVQPVIRDADRARPRLSLGQRQASGRHQLRRSTPIAAPIP